MMKEAVEFMEQMKTPFYAWFAGALVLIIDHPDDVYTVLIREASMPLSQIAFTLSKILLSKIFLGAYVKIVHGKSFCL